MKLYLVSRGKEGVRGVSYEIPLWVCEDRGGLCTGRHSRAEAASDTAAY